MRSLAKTRAFSTAFFNDKITTHFSYSSVHCTYLFVMLQHTKLQYAWFLWHIKGASLANTDGYMTVMMGKRQYLPLNKEPSVHKYWVWHKIKLQLVRLGVAFPQAHWNLKFCYWPQVNLGLFLQMKDLNALAPKKALSLQLVLPHMARWEGNCISDISHLKLKFSY